MNLEEMKRKYAYTLARVGLNVQKGQTVLVEAAIEGSAFTPVFCEECYKLGASNVVVHYLDQANLKVASLYRSKEDVEKVEDWEVLQNQKYLDEGACYVRLEGVNPKLMEDLPEEKANAVFAHVDAVRNIMRKASRDKHCQWLIAMIPTKEWADYIMPDVEESKRLEELWKLLLKLCYIDETNDVVQTWKEKRDRNHERGKKIDAYHFTKFHYTASNGTDLVVELTPDSKFSYERKDDGISFTPNIPTEEIFSAPKKTGVNGKLYSALPLAYNGAVVKDFWFEFKDGQVVDYDAKEGKEVLTSILETDEGSKYLGEIALVPYGSPISAMDTLFYETLIDENASCHFALGASYNECIENGLNISEEELLEQGMNQSFAHVDFMVGTSDLSIEATLKNGEKIFIFKDGKYTTEFDGYTLN